MDKSRIKNFLFFDGIKRLLQWARRTAFIIIAAVMIGFTNAFYNEDRTVNDLRNFDEMEQEMDDKDTNES